MRGYRKYLVRILLCMTLGGLWACGQKGDLYLPDAPASGQAPEQAPPP